MKHRFEVRYDATLDLWLVVENTFEGAFGRGRFASREAAELHARVLRARAFEGSDLAKAVSVIGEPTPRTIVPYRRRRS